MAEGIREASGGEKQMWRERERGKHGMEKPAKGKSGGRERWGNVHPPGNRR